MSERAKVVLFKNRRKDSKFFLALKGFADTSTIHQEFSQKIHQNSQKSTSIFPHLKFRILIEKSCLKEFYFISLCFKLKGKDVSIRLEDSCPHQAIEKSLSHLKEMLQFKKADLASNSAI